MDSCLYCSSPLMPGSRRRYCSSPCRQAAFRSRRQRHASQALSALFSDLRKVSPPELRQDLYERVKALGLVL